MPWENRTYTRKDLYEEVWATPAWTLAKKFGISGVALAKRCRQMGVPRPGRGYWAKKAHGHKVARVPLFGLGQEVVPREFMVWSGPGDPPAQRIRERAHRVCRPGCRGLRP